jgi:hypothetical protein
MWSSRSRQLLNDKPSAKAAVPKLCAMRLIYVSEQTLEFVYKIWGDSP